MWRLPLILTRATKYRAHDRNACVFLKSFLSLMSIENEYVCCWMNIKSTKSTTSMSNGVFYIEFLRHNWYCVRNVTSFVEVCFHSYFVLNRTQRIILTINEKRSWNCFQASWTINNKWVARSHHSCWNANHFIFIILLNHFWLNLYPFILFCVCGSRFQHSYKIVMLFKILRLCKITARTVLVCLNVPFIFQIFFV